MKGDGVQGHAWDRRGTFGGDTPGTGVVRWGELGLVIGVGSALMGVLFF